MQRHRDTHRKGRSKPSNLREQINLEVVEQYRKAKLLPTPTHNDGAKNTKKWREDFQNSLTASVFNPMKMVPTPSVVNYKGAPKNRFLGSPTYKGNLAESVRLSESSSIHLNPPFVEQLMGFPVGWTELKD